MFDTDEFKKMETKYLYLKDKVAIILILMYIFIIYLLYII